MNEKNFEKKGYCIINLFSKLQINLILKQIKNKINLDLKQNNFKIKLKKLKNYHQEINRDEVHNFIVRGANRNISLNKELISKIRKNRKIYKILKKYWGHNIFRITWVGAIEKKEVKKNFTAFRLARPYKFFKKDVGGVHYDLPYGRSDKPNSDHKATMTIWCPIVGFNKNYSLKISPSSHLNYHDPKNILKQKKFLSAVFSEKYLKNFKFIRPSLKPGQAIIFHPNLLHGASYNLGNNTRVSIDLRIFNTHRALI